MTMSSASPLQSKAHSPITAGSKSSAMLCKHRVVHIQKPQEHGHICMDTDVFTHHVCAVECEMWRTQSNTKIWVLREETKPNFFSRKHIKAAGVRECEYQRSWAPPVSPSSHSPNKTLSGWNDTPSFQSPALGCPAGLGSTSKPSRCLHVCPERAPRLMLPLPCCNPNLPSRPPGDLLVWGHPWRWRGRQHLGGRWTQTPLWEQGEC